MCLTGQGRANIKARVKSRPKYIMIRQAKYMCNILSVHIVLTLVNANRPSNLVQRRSELMLTKNVSPTTGVWQNISNCISIQLPWGLNTTCRHTVRCYSYNLLLFIHILCNSVAGWNIIGSHIHRFPGVYYDPYSQILPWACPWWKEYLDQVCVIHVYCFRVSKWLGNPGDCISP